MKIQDSDIRNLIQKAVETSYVSTIVLDSKNIELISKYRDCVNDLTKDKEFLSCPFLCAKLDIDFYGHKSLCKCRNH